MDSDLAWVIINSGRQSWRYADAFQRSIISEAIYHFYHLMAEVVQDRDIDDYGQYGIRLSKTIDIQTIEFHQYFTSYFIDVHAY